MDWDTIGNGVAFVTLGIAGLATFLGVFFVKRSKTTSTVIDGDVLSEFRAVLERVVKLEVQLAAAWARIDEMETKENELVQKVTRREERILLLERENQRLASRVEHLERVCKRAGINGDEFPD